MFIHQSGYNTKQLKLHRVILYLISTDISKISQHLIFLNGPLNIKMIFFLIKSQLIFIVSLKPFKKCFLSSLNGNISKVDFQWQGFKIDLIILPQHKLVQHKLVQQNAVCSPLILLLKSENQLNVLISCKFMK